MKELLDIAQSLEKVILKNKSLLDKEISKMSDEDKKKFVHLRNLAQQGKVLEVNDFIDKNYKNVTNNQ